jgi:hypothetical protein
MYKIFLSIIGSLAGVSYFGPVAGHGFISRDLDMLKEERRRIAGETQGLIKGMPIEALPAGEGADHFVRVHKKEDKADQESIKEEGN